MTSSLSPGFLTFAECTQNKSAFEKLSASGASQQCSGFRCSYKDAALVRSALCARVMRHVKRRTQYLKQNKFILHATSDQLQVEPADPEPAAVLLLQQE